MRQRRPAVPAPPRTRDPVSARGHVTSLASIRRAKRSGTVKNRDERRHAAPPSTGSSRPADWSHVHRDAEGRYIRGGRQRTAAYQTPAPGWGRPSPARTDRAAAARGWPTASSKRHSSPRAAHGATAPSVCDAEALVRVQNLRRRHGSGLQLRHEAAVVCASRDGHEPQVPCAGSPFRPEVGRPVHDNGDWPAERRIGQ
jgi:hypothetical protein